MEEKFALLTFYPNHINETVVNIYMKTVDAEDFIDEYQNYCDVKHFDVYYLDDVVESEVPAKYEKGENTLEFFNTLYGMLMV